MLSMGIFLDRGVHHVLHTAVVPQVDDLGAGALDDPPHDVDGGIMAVEQRGGGNDADLVLGDVGGGNGVGHGAKIPVGGECPLAAFTGCPLWCPCPVRRHRGSGVPPAVGPPRPTVAHGPACGQPPLPSRAEVPVPM